MVDNKIRIIFVSMLDKFDRARKRRIKSRSSRHLNKDHQHIIGSGGHATVTIGRNQKQKHLRRADSRFD